MYECECHLSVCECVSVMYAECEFEVCLCGVSLSVCLYHILVSMVISLVLIKSFHSK